MSKRGTWQKNYRSLWISLVVSVFMLALGLAVVPKLDVAAAGGRLVLPLGRLLLFIAIGLAVGQIIEALEWTRFLGIVGAPLFRFARLGPQCSATFTTAFFSGTAANAMLFDFWQDGKIGRFQLFMTNLANQLPAFFLHLPTTVFIVLPLTGWAGGIYFIITFLAALSRFIIVLILGRMQNEMPGHQDEAIGAVAGANQPRKKASIWSGLGAKLPRRLMGVATYVVPIYIAVFLLNMAGVFAWTQQWLVRTVSTAFIPVEALSLVVLSFAAEFTSGFAAAGALLKEGVLSTKQAVTALLIGNIVAFPIRALRHQLPRLMGIFAPKMGMQLLLAGQGFRIVSLVFFGVLYYFFF